MKYLTIIVDESLIWNEHFKMFKCKIKIALSSLQILTNGLNLIMCIRHCLKVIRDAVTNYGAFIKH